MKCDKDYEDKPEEHGDAVWEVRQPRPSDRHDLVCIMTLCDRCKLADDGDLDPHFGPNGGTATGEQWDEFMETDGPRLGFTWLI